MEARRAAAPPPSAKQHDTGGGPTDKNVLFIEGFGNATVSATGDDITIESLLGLPSSSGIGGIPTHHEARLAPSRKTRRGA